MQLLTVNTFSMTVLHSNGDIINGKHLVSNRNLQAFILFSTSVELGSENVCMSVCLSVCLFVCLSQTLGQHILSL